MQINSFAALLLGLFALASFSHEPLSEPQSSFQRENGHDSGRSLAFSKSKKTSHANLDGGSGYNSNPYLVKDAEISGGGSLVFKLAPSGCYFGEHDKFNLSASASTDVALLLGSDQPARLVIFDALASAGAVFALEKYVSFHSDGSLNANRQVESLFLASLTKLDAQIDFGVKFRPGNGVITILGQGEISNESFYDFNQPDLGKYSGDLSGLGAQAYYFYGKLAWEFNPNEEVFASTRFGAWRGNEESLLTTTRPLWVNLGVSGLIAPEVKGTLSAGYANSHVKLTSTDLSLDGGSLAFSLLADLRWNISEDTELYFTLEREMTPMSVFLDAYITQLKVDYRQKFLQDFTLMLKPAFTFFEYGKPLADNQQGRLAGNHRNDMLLSIESEIMYFFKEWLSFGLSHHSKLRWSNASDLHINTAPGKLADNSGNLVSSMSQHEIIGFAKLMY